MAGYAAACRVLLERMRTEAGEADEAVLRAWDRQIRVESSALEATIQNFREGVADMLRRGEGPNLSGAQRLMVGWFNPLRTLIAEEQQAVRHSLSHQAPRAGACLGSPRLPRQWLAAVAMLVPGWIHRMVVVVQGGVHRHPGESDCLSV